MRWFVVLTLGAGAALAQTNSPSAASGREAEEKEACTRNLKVIFDAVSAYRHDKKDLPNWLSDLVPQYLAEANVLICPVCRRTGLIESGPAADPRISSSYLYEFCPAPLGREATNAPSRTRREWKRRQMGLVGSVVPMVRCRHHTPVLNLAFDGRIYESPPSWELTVTNLVNPADLSTAKLFPRETQATAGAGKKKAVPGFDVRRQKAPKEQLDLSSYYNAMLTVAWQGPASNHLASLPRGLQTFNGVDFDVRGIIQLGSKAEAARKFPPQVQGIQVGQTCHRLHFLHAAGFGTAADEGKQIGAYVVHFASPGGKRLEIPIVYGRDVRNWHARPNEPPARGLTTAWTGENAVSKRTGSSLRLFLTTWTNATPAVAIESIDYVSNLANPAPFLIAITVD